MKLKAHIVVQIVLKFDTADCHRHASLDALPGAPDAAFVGVNRQATIDIVRKLSDSKAGGAVCFAGGFGETVDGAELQSRLLTAAGEMSLLGPNCYGFVNYLDRALLWPDQHGRPQRLSDET